MADWDGPDLGPLVREVDHAAARSLFDRRRRRRHQHGRFLGIALMAILLVVAGVAGRLVLASEREPTVTLGPAVGQTGDVAFEVLARRQAVNDSFGQLRAATTTAEFAALWSDVGFTDALPTVDLSEVVVVSVTIPDDACPPELVGFTRDGDELTPEFEEQPSGVCELSLIGRTFVIAIDRDSIGHEFVLHLPAAPLYDNEDRRLSVDLAEDLAGGPVTASVTVELEDAPLFVEGFDYAVRFRAPDGTVLAERWLEDFEWVDPWEVDSRENLAQGIFELPTGSVLVDSHLTVGPGGGPARPDLSTEPGSGVCPPMALELSADQPVRLSLNWDTGCLEPG